MPEQHASHGRTSTQISSREILLQYATAAALQRGLIWFQCNTPHCSVSNNQVANNILTGNH